MILDLEPGIVQLIQSRNNEIYTLCQVTFFNMVEYVGSKSGKSVWLWQCQENLWSLFLCKIWKEACFALSSDYYLLELLSQLTVVCRLSHPKSRDCRDKGGQSFKELFTESKSDNSQGNHNSYNFKLAWLFDNLIIHYIYNV